MKFNRNSNTDNTTPLQVKEESFRKYIRLQQPGSEFKTSCFWGEAMIEHIKANRYYKVRFYPLCMNPSYNYPWSSDWSKGLSPKEKIIWMYPGNVSNLFLFNKHLVFCFESWEISIVLLVVS